MAEAQRGSRLKPVPLSQVRDGLGQFLHDAERQEVAIMRRGRPSGVLIGFASEEDWFGYELESDPRFQQRIEAARRSLRAGRSVQLEDVEIED